MASGDPEIVIGKKFERAGDVRTSSQMESDPETLDHCLTLLEKSAVFTICAIQTLSRTPFISYKLRADSKNILYPAHHCFALLLPEDRAFIFLRVLL